VVALARGFDERNALRDLIASGKLSGDVVRVTAAGYSAEFSLSDVAALVIHEPRERAVEAVTGLSLRLLAVAPLLSCGLEGGPGFLNVTKPRGMGDEVFRRFAHACLVRVAQIEQASIERLEAVLGALRSNDDLVCFGGLESLHDAVDVLADDFRRVRRCSKIRRRYGRADGTYFPPDVRCRRHLGWLIRVGDGALARFALTDGFPSSRAGYPCSWDQRGDSVTSLVIPSVGLHSLLRDLRGGRVFGYKVAYLYAGRAMLPWDICGFIVIGGVFVCCELMKGFSGFGVAVKGVCTLGGAVLRPVVACLSAKILLYDLTHWFPWHKWLVGFFRRAGRGETDIANGLTERPSHGAAGPT
jgi:hypothetical protein